VITSKLASNNRCLYFDSTGELVPPYERCVCRSEGARSRTERTSYESVTVQAPSRVEREGAARNRGDAVLRQAGLHAE
jgi:hypothetical protein